MYLVSAICLSSCRVRLTPVVGSGFVQLWGPALAGPPHVFSATHEGSEDLVVVLAATEIAGDAVRELLPRRVRVGLQETDGRHCEARHAEGALEALLVDDRLLHRMKLRTAREPFDRPYLSSSHRVR